MDYCKVLLVGRTCQVPTLKTTPNGKFVATTSVATSRKQGHKWVSSFLALEGWGVVAEHINNIPKGTIVSVCGNLRVDTWVDDHTGIRHNKTVVTVDVVRPLTAANSNNFEPQQQQDSWQDDSDVLF